MSTNIAQIQERIKDMAKKAPAEVDDRRKVIYTMPTRNPGICDMCGIKKQVRIKSSDNHYDICWLCINSAKETLGSNWRVSIISQCKQAILLREAEATKRAQKLQQRRDASARKKELKKHNPNSWVDTN